MSDIGGQEVAFTRNQRNGRFQRVQSQFCIKIRTLLVWVGQLQTKRGQE